MSELEKIGENLKKFATGSNSEKYTFLIYPFDMYEIIVKLTSDGKFAGIEEVRINKDFRDFKNKTEQSIFLEIDELPKETPQE